MFDEIQFNESRKIDRTEATVSRMIARIKRSRYAKNCFADVRQMVNEGYVRSIALLHSSRYWTN